jgi:hydroxymethylpyrimidine/phosphomethylpyrimidine kinase
VQTRQLAVAQLNARVDIAIATATIEVIKVGMLNQSAPLNCCTLESELSAGFEIIDVVLIS